MSIESGEKQREPEKIIGQTHETINREIEDAKERMQKQLDQAKERIQKQKDKLDAGEAA